MLHTDIQRTLSTIFSDIAQGPCEFGPEDAEKGAVSVAISKAVQIVGRLSEWRSKLPTWLQILNSKDLSEPKVSGNLDLYSTRFRVFLSLRYLSTRALAYRAVLDLQLKEPDPNDNSSDQTEPLEHVTLALLEDCASCCRLLIDIAKSVVKVSAEGVNINGAWWLSTHFGQLFNVTLKTEPSADKPIKSSMPLLCSSE